MPTTLSIASAGAEGVGDWCLGTIDFLDFRALGAYLAACQRCLCHVDCPAVWEGWRRRHLDARVPVHVRWSSEGDAQLAALGSGLRRARCVHRLGHGVRLYEERLFRGAEACLRAALAELPRHEQVMCRLADALYGHAAELRAELPEAGAAAPAREGTGGAQEPRGLAAAAGGAAPEEGHTQLSAERNALLAEARQLYEEALAINANSSYAVNGLALLTDDCQEKRQLLERAVELDGDNPYALSNLAGDLVGRDDQRAVRCLDHALEINPRLFYARLFRSKALLRLGNIDGAIASTKEHLQWRPGDKLARCLLQQMERQRELMRRRMLMV